MKCEVCGSYMEYIVNFFSLCPNRCEKNGTDTNMKYTIFNAPWYKQGGMYYKAACHDFKFVEHTGRTNIGVRLTEFDCGGRRTQSPKRTVSYHEISAAYNICKESDLPWKY